jgi:hypothetical protein
MGSNVSWQRVAALCLAEVGWAVGGQAQKLVGPAQLHQAPHVSTGISSAMQHDAQETCYTVCSLRTLSCTQDSFSIPF